MAKVRILLADDHAILRSGLTMLIQSHANYEVVLQASDAEEAIIKARAQQIDVAIVDISMPGGGGVTLTEDLVQLYPGIRVIALTMHDDPAYLKAVLSAGAAGFDDYDAAAGSEDDASSDDDDARDGAGTGPRKS